MLAMMSIPEIPNDSALPQLATALDAEAMRARFQAELFSGALQRVQACEIEHVRYKPGKNCTVAYRLEIEDQHNHLREEQHYGARMFAAGISASRHVKALAQQLATPRYGKPVLHFEDLALVAWAFPNDRKLHGLPKLVDERALQNGLLSPLVANHCGGGWIIVEAQPHLIHYVPEHTCTIRTVVKVRHQQTHEARSVVLFGKTYFDAEGEEAYRNMQQLWESAARRTGVLRMAQPLAYEAQHKILWQMGLRGATLLEQDILAPHFLSLLPAAAANVAALHRTEIACSRTLARDDIHAKLVEVRDLLEAVRPEYAGALETVVQRLLAQSDRLADMPLATLHGDLHLKNFFVDGRDVYLIDLDNLCRGSAYHDLGSFIAGLHYRGLSTSAPEESISQIVEVFMSAYQTYAAWPLSQAALNWYIAAALISERVFRCITRLKAARVGMMPKLIARAHELVA